MKVERQAAHQRTGVGRIHILLDLVVQAAEEQRVQATDRAMDHLARDLREVGIVRSGSALHVVFHRDHEAPEHGFGFRQVLSLDFYGGIEPFDRTGKSLVGARSLAQSLVRSGCALLQVMRALLRHPCVLRRPVLGRDLTRMRARANRENYSFRGKLSAGNDLADATAPDQLRPAPIDSLELSMSSHKRLALAPRIA
jgi:hypothetical protein